MNNSRIGFMQGRLSPITDGKIQEFPWKNWRQEFQLANKLGFSIMEWTLDQEKLYENPLMIENGRQEIKRLCQEYPELDERYDLSSNMGYGSKRHRDGIAKYGVCQFHRMSFGCCRDRTISPVLSK